MKLRIGDLKQQAEIILTTTSPKLLAALLPSAFGEDGAGWQERWLSSPRAGLYASCDGLLLLRDVLKNVSSGDLDRATERVYYGHLCKVFDQAVEPPNLFANNMRAECTTTTMKLARFLLVSAALRPLRDNAEQLGEQVFSTLLQAGVRQGGRWSFKVDVDERPHLVPTIEAVLALASWDSEESGDCLKNAVNWLVLESAQTELRWTIIIAWALLKMEAGRGKAVDLLERVLLEEWGEIANGQVFFQSALGKGDYFHYDTELLLVELICQLYEQLPGGEQALGRIVGAVERVVDDVRECGSYPREEQDGRFWQHAQGIRSLGDFFQLAARRDGMEELAFMRVSPRHFRRQEFSCSQNLVTVLMPFGPEWSADVFTELRRTAERSGLRDVWRSDLEYGEDNVVQSIWEKINEARLLVADCTGRNPNVFYELGIAHTIGKPVFICAQERKDFPFDIGPIRSFEYGPPTPTRLRELGSRFERFIRKELKGDTR